jgi:hypothetical protein
MSEASKDLTDARGVELLRALNLIACEDILKAEQRSTLFEAAEWMTSRVSAAALEWGLEAEVAS